jgi:hypothetical protein
VYHEDFFQEMVLLHSHLGINCRRIAGKIGADGYGKDAAGAVKLARGFMSASGGS